MPNDEYNSFGGSARSTNENIIAMRADYGLDGYGLLCYIFRLIENGPFQRMYYNTATDNLIKEFNNTKINVDQFIIDCLFKYKLLEAENGFLYNAYFFKKKPKKIRKPLPLFRRIKIKEQIKARKGM